MEDSPKQNDHQNTFQLIMKNLQKLSSEWVVRYVKKLLGGAASKIQFCFFFVPKSTIASSTSDRIFNEFFSRRPALTCLVIV